MHLLAAKLVLDDGEILTDGIDAREQCPAQVAEHARLRLDAGIDEHSAEHGPSCGSRRDTRPR